MYVHIIFKTLDIKVFRTDNFPGCLDLDLNIPDQFEFLQFKLAMLITVACSGLFILILINEMAKYIR